MLELKNLWQGRSFLLEQEYCSIFHRFIGNLFYPAFSNLSGFVRIFLVFFSNFTGFVRILPEFFEYVRFYSK